MNSKVIPWIAFVPLVLIGIAIAFGSGYLYHLAHYWNPLIIFSIFFPFVFAFVLATLAANVVAVSNCEAAFAGAIVGLAIGVAGVGGKFWIPFELELSSAATEVIEQNELDAASHGELKELIRSQTSLSDHMSRRAESGFGIVVKGNDSIPVGGTFLWVLWGIEALIICLFATVGGAIGKEMRR